MRAHEDHLTPERRQRRGGHIDNMQSVHRCGVGCICDRVQTKREMDGLFPKDGEMVEGIMVPDGDARLSQLMVRRYNDEAWQESNRSDAQAPTYIQRLRNQRGRLWKEAIRFEPQRKRRKKPAPNKKRTTAQAMGRLTPRHNWH